MSLAPEDTETTYPLVGANLGPFPTVWLYADPSEVVATLNLGADANNIAGGGVDFTVVGATPLVSGGQVTLQAHLIPGGVAWPANSHVVLRRATANGQPSTFGEALGFSPAASETALDTIARQVQETERRVSRCVRAQPGETINPLPNALARKGTIPWFESDAGEVTAGQLQYVAQPEVGPGLAYLRTLDDGLTTLGTAGHRWSTVYAVTGAINVSDERAKEAIAPIDDVVLEAWSHVEFAQFRYRAEAQAHGDDAKLHVGVIAQQIVAVFHSFGLDALDYGVVTHDHWEASEVAPAGEGYGVRYDQALVLEAALMRRELRRLRDSAHS